MMARLTGSGRWLMERAPAAIVTITVIAIVVLSWQVGQIIAEQRDLHDELEVRNTAHLVEMCESQNDMRRLLGRVLDSLAEPRDDDQPGEFEERQRLRAAVDPFVQPQDCQAIVHDHEEEPT